MLFAKGGSVHDYELCERDLRIALRMLAADEIDYKVPAEGELLFSVRVLSFAKRAAA